MLIFICFACPACAQPVPISLFFTAQESREAEKLAAKVAPAGQGDISLGAILYYAPDDWAIWVQGERWTPQTARPDLQVLGVGADEVRLLWRGDGDKGQIAERIIILHPHQTYQIATGQILTSP
jgi:hypothetical protein